ncbi:OTU domain-containing protein [Wolbachia endosymbiont (group B) of Longitarsus flavicornis]|uniref:OTU domain-containing protein n=1 Tax=Wolbachia endosymbiont (group B) of Longitarsus flavicornis TaxID=3066135 RepID=UPI00333F2F2A
MLILILLHNLLELINVKYNMLGVIEKYDEFKESTHFTKLKAGGRFAIYALGIYLAATVTIGCLGLIVGSFLLTLPLAMLIFHPVAWILMGIVLAATYKMVIEPLFYLVKGYVDEKGTVKEEKSPKEQKFTRCRSLDSGLDTISRKTDNSDKRVRRNSYSPSTDSGISISSTKSEQPKQTKVVRCYTVGDGNCFFHAVFGAKKGDSSKYRAEKAQEMRLEWHKFLSQFNSLDDERMPPALRAELRTVFNMFLDRPRDLTDKYKEIEKLAEHTKKKIKKVEKKVEKLIKKLLSTGLPENEVSSNLRELAVNNLISTKRYDKNYSSESVTNSFLNGKSIYRSYLEAISSQNYFIFIEEIPILASLANIEIHLHPHISHNQGIFKPNPEMINEGYQRNNELWGNKKQETIYLKPGHYERAKVVEAEPSLIEKANSFMQDAIIAAYNSVKNAFSSD